MGKTLQEICGLDEAGRGALAGPIVAAAVILTLPGIAIAQSAGIPLRDGKLLSPTRREQLYDALEHSNALIKSEYISARLINAHGIGWANKEIFRRLIRKIQAGRYIVDGKLKLGTIRGKTHLVHSVIDADATIDSVIFAGISAKVLRDRMMYELHTVNPEYHWIKNVGYGTRKHIEAIQKSGITRHHRTLFVTTALNTFHSA